MRPMRPDRTRHRPHGCWVTSSPDHVSTKNPSNRHGSPTDPTATRGLAPLRLWDLRPYPVGVSALEFELTEQPR